MGPRAGTMEADGAHQVGGVAPSGAEFRLLFIDSEAELGGHVAPSSVDLVVSSPPWFRFGQSYEDPAETWEAHWAQRRAALDLCVIALKPGGKIALHLADHPLFDSETGITEERLGPPAYADYLRRRHGCVLWHRFIVVEPQPWTHYQHYKRLALGDGGVQVLADADHMAHKAIGRGRPARAERPRRAWTYICIFRKPGGLTACERQELACLGWKTALVLPDEGGPATVVDLAAPDPVLRGYLEDAVWELKGGGCAADEDIGTHRCPWPLELPMRLIRLYSPAGGWVLDPYVGTGRTIEAAAQLGRNAVGCENHPEYVELLRRKFGAAAADAASDSFG